MIGDIRFLKVIQNTNGKLEYSICNLWWLTYFQNQTDDLYQKTENI